MLLPFPTHHSEISPWEGDSPKSLSRSIQQVLDPGPLAFERRYPKSRPSKTSRSRTPASKLDPIIEETTPIPRNDSALSSRNPKPWRCSWRSSCPTAVDLDLDFKSTDCVESVDSELPVQFHINTPATDLYSDTDFLLHNNATSISTAKQRKELGERTPKALELPFIRDDDFQYYPLVPLSRTSTQNTVCDEGNVGTGKVQILKRMSLVGKKKIWERIAFKREGWRLLGRRGLRTRDR